MKSNRKHIKSSFESTMQPIGSTRVTVAGQKAAVRIRFAVRALLAIAFAVCAAVAVFSMLEIDFEPYLFAVAIGAAFVEILISLKPPAMRGVNIALAVAAVIACVMRPGWLYEGLPLACNKAMEVSAAHQAYEYDLFAIGLPAEAEPTALAVGLGFVMALVLFVAAASIMSGCLAPLFALMALFVTAQCYWGIAPYSWITVLLALIVAASLAVVQPVIPPGMTMRSRPRSNRKRTTRQKMTVSPKAIEAYSPSGILAAALAAVLAMGAVSGVVAAAYPHDYWDGSPSIAAINEGMRDAAAGGESVVDAIANGVADVIDQGSVSGTEAQGDADESGAEHAAEARSSTSLRATPIPLWMYLVAMMLAALLVAIVVYLLIRHRVRRLFASPDPRVAGDALFRNAMRRLRLIGLKPVNRGFRDFEGQVADLVGDESTVPFCQLVTCWQKLRYSSVAAEADDIAGIRASYDALVTQIRQSRRVKLAARIKTALLCYTRN